VFVKADKKLLGNYKDTILVNYGIYYSHKMFYDIGPRLRAWGDSFEEEKQK
jgi:hypothetical protein